MIDKLWLFRSPRAKEFHVNSHLCFHCVSAAFSLALYPFKKKNGDEKHKNVQVKIHSNISGCCVCGHYTAYAAEFQLFLLVVDVVSQQFGFKFVMAGFMI